LLAISAASAQTSTTPKKFSHPALSEIEVLVSDHQYPQAINISLQQANQQKKEKNWEGYISFMLRAAEIETFEVWKAKGFPEIKIKVDYLRPLAYLDTLSKFAGKYVDLYPYLKANILFTKAVVYDWLLLPDTAESMHLEALKMRTELYGNDSREVGDSYMWMGVLNKWGLLRKDRAEHYFLKARPLQEKYMPASRYALGTTYYGLAVIAVENFEFDEVETLVKEYLSLYKDLPYEHASAYSLVANQYGSQGDFEKSLQSRRQALRIFENSGFKEDLIITYSNLSRDLKGLRRFDEAKEALRKGLRIFETLVTKDPFYSRALYQNLGDLYRIMGKYDSSEFYLNKALSIAEHAYGKHNEESAKVYANRGKLFLDRNQQRLALHDFQQMLVSTISDFQVADISTIPAIQRESAYFLTIIEAHFNKADAFVAWYKMEKNPDYLEQAVRNYRAAFHQLMVARNAMGDELSKPILMQNFEKSIEHSIYCATMLYKMTKLPRYFQDVFQFVELTKYLNVLDALRRAERANNSGIPKSLLYQLDEVRKELKDVQRTILKASESETNLLPKLNEAELNLINRRRELMSEISRYPGTVTADMDSLFLRVSAIQSQLSPDEQILEFFWGKDSTYVLSITDLATSIASIARDVNTDSVLSSVHQFMGGLPSFEQARITDYSLWTSGIYRKFFGPFIQKKKVTVIPDGPLSLISADALVVSHKPGKFSYSTLDYLIHHYEISYAYSCSILFKNSLKDAKTARSVLAFSYSGGPGVPTLASRDQPAELPGTFKELEALSRLFRNVQRFTDQDASKRNFINNAAGVDIIHLGVHGIGDQVTADNSRLIFKRDSTNDAELYAYEIYNLKLDAGLVVLSACESGIGRNQVGEGMFSIARAFTYAGCPSLVMSLWQVRDVFTSQIMIDFYENLNQQTSVSGSLRNAKLKFLRESDSFAAHPANWAAFVVNGQDLSFEKELINSVWTYVTLALLLIAIIIIYFLRKSR
jgi:tetratricopeptide (TPR) repeat protein